MFHRLFIQVDIMKHIQLIIHIQEDIITEGTTGRCHHHLQDITMVEDIIEDIEDKIKREEFPFFFFE